MPRCWLLSSRTLTGSFSQKQVASSWMFIWKLPSPSMSITRRSGMRDLGAHGGGQAEAHRAQAAAGQPASRSVELEELGGPHLVLADAHRDDRVAILRSVRHSSEIACCGRMPSNSSVVVERIVLLPSHDTADASRTGLRAARPSCSAPVRKYFTSLQIGMWATLFLFSSEASMSTCTILACLANSESLPVTRSSNRTPRASSRSASSIA